MIDLDSSLLQPPLYLLMRHTKGPKRTGNEETSGLLNFSNNLMTWIPFKAKCEIRVSIGWPATERTIQFFILAVNNVHHDVRSERVGANKRTILYTQMHQ